MILKLFLCLLLAHLIADFVLQTNEICESKANKKWRSLYHYVHGAIVFVLSWVVLWDIKSWWCALIIGLTHVAIDMWKSYQGNFLKSFVIDQILHIAVLIAVAFFKCKFDSWSLSCVISTQYVALLVAVIICWQPANIFIKLMLRRYSVKIPKEQSDGINVGALIGNIERWLILIFVMIQRYDAIGLLIAAKSIIRFGDRETTKTEYVLAGTLMSIFIAVLAGMMVILLRNFEGESTHMLF